MQDDHRDAALTIRIRRSHLWGLGGVLIGLAVGLLIGNQNAGEPKAILYGIPPQSAERAGAAAGPASVPPKGPVKVDVAGRPARGPEDSKVTLVEFVDYQCPFCGRFARDTLPKLEEAYGEKVRYVSRHFPLSIHEHAMEAGVAAECAHRLGRFWEYHEALFAHQDELDVRGLKKQAKAVGLDPEAFRTCMKSSAAKDQVQRDLADGQKYGVTGTPTLFVNGTPLVGALPFEQYKAAIDKALARRPR